MTGRSGVALCIALGLALAAAPAAGQSPPALLTEGVAAYENLEFALAARLLRRAVASEAEPALAASDVERALMYLGASEVLLDQQNDAVRTFRTLVLTNPRYRPDQLVFPPRVTRAFSEVLQTTKAVAVEAPPRTVLVTRTERIGFRIFPTSEHRIRASVVTNEGVTVRVLYDGVIEGPRTVTWNGLDGRGQIPPPGNYRLAVESMVTQGNTLRSLQMPITLEAAPYSPVEAPPPPPESLLKPEKRRATAGLSILVPSLVVGAALLVPALADSGGSGARIAVGGAVTLGGIVGFVLMRPGAPLPDNVAYNDSVRASWDRRAREADRENQRRQGITRFIVYTGPPYRVEGR